MSRLMDSVIDQVIAEGPQICDPDERQRYVEEQVNSWTNVELLERISNALESAVLYFPRPQAG